MLTTINDVVKFLIENPVQYLGTTDEDGNPKVRPFQFMLEKDISCFSVPQTRKKFTKK